MKKIFVIIFVTVLVLFSVFNIIKPDVEFSENENRYLAKMPEFSFQSLLDGSFNENFEKYITDQIAFRDFFVFVKSNSEKLIGKSENNNVYFCDDGYLIDVPPKFNESIVNNNIKGINALSETGKYNVCLSLIPTAYEILKDKLPENAYKDIQQKVLNYVKNNLVDVNYTDSTETLRKYKDEYIYYRTDHHQTMNGSFYVYQDIIKNLDKNPYEKEDFTITEVANDFYGTTWSKSQVNTEPDKIIKYEPLFDISYTTEYVDKNEKYNSLYKEENLKIKDKYTYYLGGNNSIVNIKTSIKNGEKLAVIKDSYAHSIIPFLANHYEEIMVVDLRYFSYNLDEFLTERNIKDVLFIYNVTNFINDNNLIKISAYLK